jgi:hypothetical protein
MSETHIIKTNIAAILVAMFFCATVSAQDARHLILHIRNKVGDTVVRYDSANYSNALGQQYSITNVKYYISNISVTDSAGKIYKQKDGYYLVREDEDSSQDISLTDIPSGNYKTLSFLIGVDSLRNCSGAQSGALDPINGMFWTWNSGYIFFKLEGKSPSSKQPGHIFEYHIGGYKEPTNFIREVHMDLTAAHEEEDAKKGNPGLLMEDIIIRADLAKVMDAKTKVDISKLSSVTDFHNAGIIADNYQRMFSLLQIIYGF